MKLYGISNWSRLTWFIDVNVEETVKRYYAELDELKGQTPDVREMSEDNVFRLDPGGPLLTKIPSISFVINEITFEIQPHNAEHMVWELEKRGKEDVEGIIRFHNESTMALISKELRDLLVEKLKEINKSDEAMHAEITKAETYESVADHENLALFASPKIDIGNGQTVDIKELREEAKNLGEEIHEHDEADWWKDD
jgi:hypothetical protein